MTGTVIPVHVTPRAGRDEIVGWLDGELRVRLKAPPVEGAANEGLKRFLAKSLGVAPSAIEIVSGVTSRHKRVRVQGLSDEEVQTQLG